MFGLNERMQDSQGQVRTQGNALDLLEVAMWVALTQHQTGRKFRFEHLANASSWSTQMVSLVTGLEGVVLITVDLCTLGMADEDERSHCSMTTIMTSDSVVAAQEHDRQFCEVLMTASGPTRAKTTHDADSKKRRRTKRKTRGATRTSNQQNINVPQRHRSRW